MPESVKGSLSAHQTISTLAWQKKCFATNTEGISVVMYIMFLTGVISWIAYGIMRSDFAVLIANIVTLFLAAPVLVITLINRRKKHV
ncbi:TPA: hypothetical protein IGZ65_004901 [Escherichia coli]|nr:hypothetical protein [Escherichia coli]